MEARKLLNHLMVLSPAMLLTSIGIEARYCPAPYDEAPVPPVTQQHITAYIDVMRDTAEVLGDGARVTPEGIRTVAHRWIDGRRTGRLNSVPPNRFEDTPRDGARGQIFDSRARVLNALQKLVRSELEKGRLADAATDSVLVLQVAETFKYSELYTVGASSIEQRAALGNLELLLPKLDAPRSEWVLRQCAEVLRDQRPLDKLIRLSRQQFVEAGRERSHLSDQDVERLGAIDEIMGGEGSVKLVIHEIGATLGRARDGGLPMFLASIRMGLQSQEHVRRKLQSVLASATKQ